MAFDPPDPALVDALLDALPDDDRVERKKMFGCPAVFVHRNMFGGVHEQCLNVRLAPEHRAEALALPGAHPFDPMKNGRVMKEYVCLPRDLADDPEALRTWVARAFAFAASLPPKPEKTRKKKG